MEHHIPVLVAVDGGQLEQYNPVLVADDDDNQQIEQHIPDLVANDEGGQIEHHIPVLVDDDHSVTTDVCQSAKDVTGNDTPVTEDSQKNSQDTEFTITKSNPSQTLLDDIEAENDQGVTTIKTYGEKGIQTDECILVSKDEYEQLIHKASKYVDFKGDLDKIIKYFLSVSNQCPVMDPAEFEKICEQIGADNIYKVLCSTKGTERMSNERKYLTKLRAMVVIYIMMYSHSQRVNLFQVTLARTL